MSAVIHLLPSRTCAKCEHFSLREDDEGLSAFCRLWQEPMDDERAAADCPDYEPQQERAST